MKKHHKNKPGSPTEPASTDVTQVQQENEPHPTMATREMNKPFTLVITVPNDEEMSAFFSPVTVETAAFPVDRDNETLHTFIVNKITDMTTDAMKPFFEMSSEIRDALHRLVQEHYKRDATGEEYFRFLTSHRPNNSNVAITFGAACRQCLHSDSPSGCFIWVYPPEEFVCHVLDLVCFTLKDRPDNESWSLQAL